MTDINVGAISEALNNKVDLNQMNTNTQGLSYASGWGMPSDRYIDLTLGASGSTYTAPANGFYAISKISTATMQIVSVANMKINMFSTNYSSGSGLGLKVYIPVKKGDTCRVQYTADGATEYFRFIYAEGEQ